MVQELDQRGDTGHGVPGLEAGVLEVHVGPGDGDQPALLKVQLHRAVDDGHVPEQLSGYGGAAAPFQLEAGLLIAEAAAEGPGESRGGLHRLP